MSAAPGEQAQVGQIWASTHSMDTRTGTRQRREVTAVRDGYAFLRTEGSRQTGSHGVKLTKGGKVKNHRLVVDAPVEQHPTEQERRDHVARSNECPWCGGFADGHGKERCIDTLRTERDEARKQAAFHNAEKIKAGHIVQEQARRADRAEEVLREVQPVADQAERCPTCEGKGMIPGPCPQKKRGCLVIHWVMCPDPFHQANESGQAEGRPTNDDQLIADLAQILSDKGWPRDSNRLLRRLERKLYAAEGRIAELEAALRGIAEFTAEHGAWVVVVADAGSLAGTVHDMARQGLSTEGKEDA